MRYGSVCSGIEAATVAWRPLGWTCAFVAQKKLLQAYRAQPVVAARLCTSADLSDFKENERFRLTDIGDLKPVGADMHRRNGAACRVVSEGTQGRSPSPQGAPVGARDLYAQGDGADALLGRRPPHAVLRVQWMSLSSRWLARSKSMWHTRRAVRGHAFSVLIRVSEC